MEIENVVLVYVGALFLSVFLAVGVQRSTELLTVRGQIRLPEGIYLYAENQMTPETSINITIQDNREKNHSYWLYNSWNTSRELYFTVSIENENPELSVTLQYEDFTWKTWLAGAENVVTIEKWLHVRYRIIFGEGVYRYTVYQFNFFTKEV